MAAKAVLADPGETKEQIKWSLAAGLSTCAGEGLFSYKRNCRKYYSEWPHLFDFYCYYHPFRVKMTD